MFKVSKQSQVNIEYLIIQSGCDGCSTMVDGVGLSPLDCCDGDGLLQTHTIILSQLIEQDGSDFDSWVYIWRISVLMELYALLRSTRMIS